MKTNPNDCVTGFITSGRTTMYGLTKREYFASMALQGILAGRKDELDSDRALWMANAAVECADCLIDELNKDLKPKGK